MPDTVGTTNAVPAAIVSTTGALSGTTTSSFDVRCTSTFFGGKNFASKRELRKNPDVFHSRPKDMVILPFSWSLTCPDDSSDDTEASAPEVQPNKFRAFLDFHAREDALEAIEDPDPPLEVAVAVSFVCVGLSYCVFHYA